MENSIIGREKEKTELKKYISSKQSEFIAIYGRRRVGKTFLVKELLEGKFTFRMTGKENAHLGEQLLNFSYALADFFHDDRVPQNWTEAFRLLSKNIECLALKKVDTFGGPKSKSQWKKEQSSRGTGMRNLDGTTNGRLQPGSTSLPKRTRCPSCQNM